MLWNRLEKLPSLVLVAVLSSVAFSANARSIQPDSKHREHDLLRAVRMIQTAVPHKTCLSAPPSKSTGQQLLATPLGSISGHVSGLDSSAIGFAYVTAWSADSTFSEWHKGYAIVDSNFTYRIDSLLAGRYYVMAWADGYYSQYYDHVEDPTFATMVQVFEGQITENIDFYLQKIIPGTGSIAGNVSALPQYSPIAEAAVYAFSKDAPYYYGKTLTDENGDYIINELKSGQYIVEVYAKGYIPEIYDDAYSYETATLITAEEPNQTTGINFLLEKGGAISGRVVDQNGRPLPDVYLTAEKVDADSLQDWRPSFNGYGVTDSNGFYIIEGLTSGDYLVRADWYSPWQWSSLWYPDVASPELAQAVTVQKGEETGRIDFHFFIRVPIGTISGRVTNAKGQPIENASIQLQPVEKENDGWSWFYGTTDRDGYFRIEQIPAGTYVAACWAQCGWQTIFRYWPEAETPDEAKKIIINEETPSVTIDFSLPLTLGSASISGYVHSIDGRPLDGAYINISNSQDIMASEIENQTPIWAYAISDSSGYYQINYLPAGRYIAYVSYWEGQNFGQQWYRGAENLQAATPIILNESEHRRDIDFNLFVRPIYGAIVGKVTDAAREQPISRAYVEIKRIWNEDVPFYRPFAWFPYHTITDESGFYSVEWLPEGEYLVSVYANGAYACYPDAVVPSLATPVKVTGGMKTEANFALKIRHDGEGSISGRVTSGPFKRSIEPQRTQTKGINYSSLDESLPEIAVVIAKPAITILVWPQSEMFYTAVTDKEGYYTLKGLPDGEFNVYSFAPYHMLQYYDKVFDPAEATLVTVKGTEPLKEIDFQLPPMLYRFLDTPGNKEGNNTASIFGRVVDKDNAVVANAIIYLLDEQGNPFSFTTSDEAGRYEFHGIPAGNYYLQAGKIGYSTTFNGNTSNINNTRPFTLSQGVLEINIILNEQTTTGVKDKALPESFAIIGNYPNPFNPETTIEFSLPNPMAITLRIVNMRGQEVNVLYHGILPAGRHVQKWDGRDTYGRVMPSGLYFICLETKEERKIAKILLVR